MEIELPDGWQLKNINQLLSVDGVFVDGDWIESKDQDPNGNVRLIQLADIGDGVFKNKSSRFLTNNRAKELNCTFLEQGDILVARMPDPIGRACIFPLKGSDKYVTAVDVAIIRPESLDVNSRYLLYNINNPKKRNEIEALQSGTTRKRISRKNLSTILFPFPKVEIQNLIVEKIEELFSELDKGIENLKTAQQQLKVYRQAVLKWAFEGKLTNENLKDGELPEGWEIVQIGDYVKCIVPNRDKPKSFTGSIPWLTTPDLDDDKITVDYSKIKNGLTVEETTIYKAKVVPANSVVMICVGKFGVAVVLSKGAVINQQLHAFLPSENFIPQYLAYNIKNQKAYCEGKSTSTTIAYLNKENCNSIPIPLCTKEEQQRIVQEIESRLSVCDKMEETITTSLQQAEALRQSILKRAFEGKLVKERRNEYV